MEKLIICLAMLIFGLTGCDTDTPIQADISGEDEKVVITSGEISLNDKTVLSNDFEILRYMTDDKNYIVSPFSLKMAMMLAANGAEGNTKNEILEVFNIQDLDGYNEYAKELIEKYNSMENVNLNVANSIWLNEDKAGKNVKFSDAYEDIIEKYYFGKAEEENADSISKEINKWIANKTNNKIKDMFDESLKARFLAVLVNTIYFKGEWETKFNEDITRKEIFTDRNSEETQIDFMHETDWYRYYEDENMKMVRLPYKDNATAMYFVLPTDENKMDIVAALDKMENYKVRLSIPKFKIEYDLSFKDVLMELGINKAFDKWGAEFKNKMFVGVSSEDNVYVDDVLQKTYIEVDENGTEAAAATTVIMDSITSIAPGEEVIKEFKADRPFIYFIMDEDTREVLFIGEYAFAK